MDSIVGYRLSPRQRHLWTLLQEGGARDARALLRLRGPLDPGALRAAVDALVARHEILRTSFERLPGMPEALQVPGEAAVRWEDADDLAALPAEARANTVDARWAEAVDGEGLPAARLLRTGVDQHLLLLRVHPLSADAPSWEHLARDLAVLYAAERGGAPVEDEPVPYLAVSEWLNDEASSDEAQEGRAYWARQCESAESPLPLERDGGESARPASARRVLPAGLSGAVDAFASAAGTGADTVLLAAWKVLLLRLGGAGAIRVGVAFDGRADDELRHAVGPFAEHLPVTVPMEPGLTFGALVERLRDALAYAANWQVSLTRRPCAGWWDARAACSASASLSSRRRGRTRGERWRSRCCGHGRRRTRSRCTCGSFEMEKGSPWCWMAAPPFPRSSPRFSSIASRRSWRTRSAVRTRPWPAWR